MHIQRCINSKYVLNNYTVYQRSGVGWQKCVHKKRKIVNLLNTFCTSPTVIFFSVNRSFLIFIFLFWSSSLFNNNIWKSLFFLFRIFYILPFESNQMIWSNNNKANVGTNNNEIENKCEYIQLLHSSYWFCILFL